jgi:hypothetical protein
MTHRAESFLSRRQGPAIGARCFALPLPYSWLRPEASWFSVATVAIARNSIL